MQKVPTAPKVRVSTTLRNLKWHVEQCRQRKLHVGFNESLNSNKHTQMSQMCSKSHHLYIRCSKCPPPVHTKISEILELKRCTKNEGKYWITPLLNVLFESNATVYALASTLETDILSIWCKLMQLTCLTIFERH